jgi:hypothetical protein
MLDELKNLFKEELQYTHTAGVLQQLGNLTQILNAQYMKDEDSKNTAIDLVCKVLQTHKHVPTPVVEEVQNATC